MELGGNIELVGFSDEDLNALVIIKKVVGTFVKRISTAHDNFSGLRITAKPIHGASGKGKIEIHGMLTLGSKNFEASDTQHNQFFTLDSVLKKLATQAKKA